MKSLISFFLLGTLLLGISFSVWAQEPPAETIQAAELDEEVQPQDLETGTPRILPDSRLYGFKEAWRGIRSFFAFNPIAKMKLSQKFANEKIIELKELNKKGAGSEIIKKAAENYGQEVERIKQRALGLKIKAKENPELNSFLDKFLRQQTLHYRVLQRLEEQVPPEAFEKIKGAREKHLERFKDVMLKLEEKEKIPERLKRVLEDVKGGEFKDIKNMEMLQELENKVPAEIKIKIQKTEEKILHRFEQKMRDFPQEKKQRLENYLKKDEKRVCVQVITPAISPDGICHNFPTPCDVPKDWKRTAYCPGNQGRIPPTKKLRDLP